MTVNEKLCNNIALKLQATYVLFVSEAILTNIQNIMFYEIKMKQACLTYHPVLHIILSIKVSYQQQIRLNGNMFGKKCCRCNEGSLYE